MDDLAGVVSAIPLSGAGAEVLYATLVEYDLATHLSTIQILDGEIAGIPKLQGVSFDGQWDLIHHEVHTSGSSFVVDIPRDYDEFEIQVAGAMSASGTVQLRLNANATVDQHLRATTQLSSAGITGATYGSGTVLFLGDYATGSGHCIARLTRNIPLVGDTIWQFQSIHGLTTNSIRVSTGRSADSIDLTSLQFLASTGTFTNMRFSIRGKTLPVAVGSQLLCMRSPMMPLTIVGVLDGATV